MLLLVLLAGLDGGKLALPVPTIPRLDQQLYPDPGVLAPSLPRSQLWGTCLGMSRVEVAVSLSQGKEEVSFSLQTLAYFTLELQHVLAQNWSLSPSSLSLSPETYTRARSVISSSRFQDDDDVWCPRPLATSVWL